MTKPDPSTITIRHSEEDVAELLDDLFVKPRALIRKWAEITHQTAQARLAYPGQHLASVVTGVRGANSAARGEDLVDSSEVKSCSRADQLGICKACKARVPAWMEDCPVCGSTDIVRKEDSHWIISIRRREELDQLIGTKRLVLVLFDRTAESRLDIRVRVWEVWPSDARCDYFERFVTDYYENNYLKKRNAAPCNLHPLKFDHLMMNPVKVFDARLASPDRPDAHAHVNFLYPVKADRSKLDPEPMPIAMLGKHELPVLAKVDPALFEPLLAEGSGIKDVEEALAQKDPRRALQRHVTGVPGQVRREFEMRPKRIKTSPSTYKRRRTQG